MSKKESITQCPKCETVLNLKTKKGDDGFYFNFWFCDDCLEKVNNPKIITPDAGEQWKQIISTPIPDITAWDFPPISKQDLDRLQAKWTVKRKYPKTE